MRSTRSTRTSVGTGLSGGSGGFSPEQLGGLVAGWRPDQGVTADGSGFISNVNGAWGTTVSLSGQGTVNKPSQVLNIGPANQPLFFFNRSDSQRFNFSSDVVTSACTLVWVCAPTDFSVLNQVFGSSPSSAIVRMQTSGGATINTITTTATGGAAGTATLTGQLRQYKNMCVNAMIYDPSTGGGTASFYYRNAEFSASAAAIGAGGFTLNRIGCTGNGTNPFQGFMGPIAIFNKMLNASQLLSMFQYFNIWAGNSIYVSSSGGSDATISPWNTSTPFQNRTTALALGFQGNENLLLKRGDVWRETATSNSTQNGASSTSRITQGSYGASGGNPQIRCSTNPTFGAPTGTIYPAALATDPGIQFTGVIGPASTLLTVTSESGGNIEVGQPVIGAGVTPGTTIASFGTGTGGNGTYNVNISQTVSSTAMAVLPTTAGKGPYLFYNPGGVVTFGNNFTIGGASQNTLTTRMARTLNLDQTNPGPGEWGWTAGNLYVNQGVAISSSEIEIPVPGMSSPIGGSRTNWTFTNLTVLFVSNRSFSNTVSSTSYIYNNCHSHFPRNDGFDTDNSPVITYNDCVSTWAGIGYVGLGGNQGDGFSTHDGGTSTFNRCRAYWNGKSGFGNGSGANIIIDRSFAIGTCPFLSAGNFVGGITTTWTNCIAVIPPEVAGFWPHGFTNNSGLNTLNIEFCTAYAFTATGNGVFQNQAGGNLLVENVIVQGFNIGLNWQGPGVLVTSNNSYFGNNTNFSGTTAGTGDLVGLNPLLTSPATYNFALAAGSPCLGKGITIVGVTADYAGTARGTPPSIGAYET